MTTAAAPPAVRSCGGMPYDRLPMRKTCTASVPTLCSADKEPLALVQLMSGRNHPAPDHRQLDCARALYW
jgi:hypothetical protein